MKELWDGVVEKLKSGWIGPQGYSRSEWLTYGKMEHRSIGGLYRRMNTIEKRSRQYMCRDWTDAMRLLIWDTCE